jgi:hypothetical protein
MGAAVGSFALEGMLSNLQFQILVLAVLMKLFRTQLHAEFK